MCFSPSVAACNQTVVPDSGKNQIQLLSPDCTTPAWLMEFSPITRRPQCFYVMLLSSAPPPPPPSLQLPSPSNHPSVEAEGWRPGWQRLKKKTGWRKMSCVCACGGCKKVTRWHQLHLITAQIHFLILELFLDLSGVSADCWAHGHRGSQSGRETGFPSL